MFKQKYPHVIQIDESDCAAACIASVIKYHGKAISINRIRETIGTGQQGTALIGLQRGAELLGFRSRPLKAPLEIVDQIHEIPLPVILHWKGYHYVVLYGRQGKKFVICDPAVGIRYLSRQELLDGWRNGILLLMEPDPIHFFEQEDEKREGILRFFKRIAPYRGLLLQIFIGAVSTGLLSLASPFFTQILTDDVLMRGDTHLLSTMIGVVIVMTLFSTGLQLTQSMMIAQFAQRLELGLILEFGRRILHLPLSYYESHRSGEIVSRLGDIQQINSLVVSTVISFPSQFFIAIISFGFMVFYSLKLTAASLALAGIMTITTFLFLPILRQKTRQLLVLEAENQGVIVETFKGALTLKTTTASHSFWNEYQSRFSRFANLVLDTTHIGIFNSTFSQLVSSFGGVAMLGLGSTLVINKELTLGQLLAFNAMSGNVLSLIGMIIGFIDELVLIQTSIQRLTDVIDTTPEDQADDRKPFGVIANDADITFHQVSFYHVDRFELLNDFSLHIPGGKVTALVGKSGSGKSTVVKLLAGLYPLKAGNIRIGLYNLQDLPLECLRQQVILVPQEAHFWSRSIIENFKLGAPQLTFEQIVRSCQITEADEFISRLPDKYQTVLGEFGVNLSGGQRQRLAIARAIVTDPPILILDESTSGLDAESETRALDKLLFHRRGKTTILISHRPSVVDRADCVVSMQDYTQS